MLLIGRVSDTMRSFVGQDIRSVEVTYGPPINQIDLVHPLMSTGSNQTVAGAGRRGVVGRGAGGTMIPAGAVLAALVFPRQSLLSGREHFAFDKRVSQTLCRLLPDRILGAALISRAKRNRGSLVNC
jgi:hypothetical protein